MFFRVIVAGGGTGGETIFYGEQLNHTNGEIIYLDFSNQSRYMAQQRARVRRLRNIIWVHNWIEGIRFLGIGRFEQLQCSGVLHHLKNPLLGLKILKDSLLRNGGMQLMIYGKYGRTSAYQMQHLLKIVNSDQREFEIELMNAKIILSIIPTSNWFVINPILHVDHTRGNIGIYDLLLHKRDKCYKIVSLYKLIKMAGMHLVDFTYYITRHNLGIKYAIPDQDLYRMLVNLNRIKQWSIIEIIRGDIKKHSFYTSKAADSVADINKPSNKMYINGAPHGFREALLNRNNQRTFENQTYFFVWLSNSYVLSPSTDHKSMAFGQYLGTTKDKAMQIYWKLNSFNIFLMNKLLESNRGISLKSTYSEYRKKTASNESNSDLFKLGKEFYMSIKHTGLFLLKKPYVTPFPKTAFTSYWKIQSI